MKKTISVRRVAAVLRRASRAAILAALVLTLGSCPEMLQTPLLEEVERIVAEGGTGPTYTVTYDANGATSGTVPVDPSRYGAGQSVTARANSGNLVKTGETFVGWNTQATGGGIDYDVGEPFNMGSSDVTLYAKWTTETTYTLSYNANGATGGTVPPPSQHPAGTTVTVSANTGGLWRTGHALTYWNPQADGSGTNYTPGTGQLVMPTGDYTLYAKWTANQYTVTFNAQDGSTPSPTSKQVTYGGTYGTLAITNRSGYTFGGWWTGSGGTGSEIKPTDTVVIGSDHTLYAKWIAAGASWSQCSLPSSQNWYSVCYGNGTFVAIANNGTVAITSSDGITWTQRSLPSSQNWQSICFGNGTFVAVSYSNVVATSFDGIAWIESYLPSSRYWHSICYGNGKFVTIAYNSAVAATSADGITWTERSLPTSIQYWYSMCYGNGTFVAVSFGYPPNNYSSDRAVTSQDGITWTGRSLPSSQKWRSVCYGNSTFVAVASGPTTVAATSSDGINWTTRSLPSSKNWFSVCYGNSTFVTITYNGTVAATSPDGITWTEHLLPTSQEWRSVCYGNDSFIAVASGPINVAATSP